MQYVMRPDLGGEMTPIPDEETRMIMVQGAAAVVMGSGLSPAEWLRDDDGILGDPETGEVWPYGPDPFDPS